MLELLRLRGGPQDLPSSRPLTVVVIVVYLGLSVLTAQNVGTEDDVSRSLLAIALQFLAVIAMLRWRNCLERLDQTLLAIAGAGVLLGLLAFALLMQADPEVNQPWLALSWFALFGWSVAVDANIYRHALGVRLPIGVLLAVLLLALTYLLLEVLFK